MSDSFALLRAASSGMDAQRAVLDRSARNVAAAEAAGKDGSYERMVPDFTLVGDGDARLVRVSGSHAQTGSSVDILTEMVAVMNASRAYEANASVFDVGKRLAERTIDLGRP